MIPRGCHDDLVLDDPKEYLSDIYVDALSLPPCPRCRSGEYNLDKECHAYICDACGLWVDASGDDEDDYT